MTAVEEKVKAKLKEIERVQNVRILYACESGSRAWGFASTDSDFDVRFVYVHPVEHYLRLDKTRDVIEYELNDIYDINGWDLCKLLQLLAKSNPTVFEWIDSPIVYKTTDEWKQICTMCGEYFRVDKMLYHYVSMARNNIRNYFCGDEVQLKKYLYILRPVLACEWIMTKKCPPPTDFNRLKAAVLPKELEDSVERLLAAKKCAGEKQTGRHMSDLDYFIQEKICCVQDFLENQATEKKADWERLNAEFRNIVLASFGSYIMHS